MTSDSLSAWLADKLNASALLLVKSFAIAEPQPSIEDMVRRGWVDRCFTQFTLGARFKIRVRGHGDQDIVRQTLTSGLTAAINAQGEAKGRAHT